LLNNQIENFNFAAILIKLGVVEYLFNIMLLRYIFFIFFLIDFRKKKLNIF